MIQSVISFLIIAFGQPAWLPWLGSVSGVVGFALFWSSLVDSKGRFWKGCLFFTAVQLVQLSWLANEEFQGKYIYLVWILLSLLWGVQFGALCTFIRREYLGKLSALLALAGGWVVLEWSRLFMMTGFPWNPVGLSLTGNLYAMQGVSIGGVYLLSFWVILTNLVVLRYGWVNRKGAAVWLLLIVAPYLWGAYTLSRPIKDEGKISVLMVQTGARPRAVVDSELWLEYGLNQWEQVLKSVQGKKALDLIVLPEGFDPFFLGDAQYPRERVAALFEKYLNLTPPGSDPHITPAFWAQLIAETTGAELICGFDLALKEQGEWQIYNAAVHFSPGNPYPNWQGKQVLLPMGEYIPGEWARSIAAQYGIKGSFTSAKERKLLQGHTPFGVTICSEELYGDLIRDVTDRGARLLVNISNDVWYPNSRLAKQHFDHGRLRAVENGVPVVRACNVGISGAITHRGEVIATADQDQLWAPQALVVDLDLANGPTLYRSVGDRLVIGLSLLVIGFGFCRYRFF